jgi:hypothetical protein
MPKRNALFNVATLIDNAVGKEVPIETSFQQDLLMCIEKLGMRDGKPSPYYKPSSLHCIRNMYYQRTETDVDSPETNAELVGIGESGTDRHLRIQEYICHMKDYGIDCEYVDVETYIKENNIPDIEVLEKHEYETKLYSPKYQMRFLVDGIVKYKGKYYILEIKTESNFKFVSRGGVDPSHYLQAYTYSLCLNIPEVLFIYENRDCCAKKFYLFPVTDENRQLIANKIETCESYVQKKIVPDKPDNMIPKICNYCGYKQRCRSDGNAFKA